MTIGTISDATLQGIVAKAIFEAMSSEDIAVLMQNALKSLMEPQEGQYGRKRESRLTEAFQNAAYTVCNQLARDFFEREAAKDQIRALLVETANKVFNNTDAREALTDRMARAFSDAIFSSR